MRYGIVSDIHGNLEALQTVAQFGSQVDDWICLGDTVGYGPNPNECAEWVRDHCSVTVIGNHDLAALGKIDTRWFNPYARAASEWTAAELTGHTREFLAGLPELVTRPELNATFAHGSLTDPPRDYVLSRSDARRNLRLLTTRSLFIGHSHISQYFTLQDSSRNCDMDLFSSMLPLVFSDDYHYICNCGSVGQPRDHDPRAAFGVFDVDLQTLEVLRVSYDVERTQKKILAANLPSLLADRLGLGY